MSLCRSYLTAWKRLAVNPETLAAVADSLRQGLSQVMTSFMEVNEVSHFYLTTALEALLTWDVIPKLERQRLWQNLCEQGARIVHIPSILENLVLICESTEVVALDDWSSQFSTSLTENLASPDHVLRDISLRLLQSLWIKVHNTKCEVLNLALKIENTAITLQSARVICMHIRNLPVLYQDVTSDEILGKAIPYHCFGLLTFKLSAVWEEAAEALRVMCDISATQDLVADIAFRWLGSEGSSRTFQSVPRSKDDANHRLTRFECSELKRLESLADLITQNVLAAQKNLEAAHDMHCLSRLSLPSDAASRSIQVLLKISLVAEKHSRRLVPLFLRWVSPLEHGENNFLPDDMPDAAAGQDPVDHGTKLRHRDGKKMLDLLGLFVNPRVLFRAPDVYHALLNLLCNGDSEIQKAALKAVLTWKQKGILPYRENLMNLLDDARFREEITAFLQTEDGSSTIDSTHYEELFPVLLRLLYGRTTSKGGRGQTAKRKTVFEALARFPSKRLAEFVDIAFGPLSSADFRDPLNEGYGDTLRNPPKHPRQLVGLLNMVHDLLEAFGSQLAFLTKKVMNAVWACITVSLEKTTLTSGENMERQMSLFKDIRQRGLHCITLLFRYCSHSILQEYLPEIFSKLLSPRLEKLPVETAQSVSGILHLFAEWAITPKSCMYLMRYDGRVLPRLVACLNIPSGKDEIKSFILNTLLKSLMVSAGLEGLTNTEVSREIELVRSLVVLPNTEAILVELSSFLERSPSKDLLPSAISLIANLAPIISGSSESRKLLEIATSLLDQPSQRVNPYTKGKLLRMTQHFVPLGGLRSQENLFLHMFKSVSSLFGYFKDRDNRLALCDTLQTLADVEPELRRVSAICVKLNAFSSSSVNEPDFDTRLGAFNQVNDTLHQSLSGYDWRPLLHNALYYIKDKDELAIRSSASFMLRRFVEVSEAQVHDPETQFPDLLKMVLLPALRLGAEETSELVRAEYLAVMAHLIATRKDWAEINDMAVLLVEQDDEASFFRNVLHVQQHRRLRALRRLATAAKDFRLRSYNIAHFLIPLVEQFIFAKAEDDNAHNLSAEAVLTIGVLAEGLEWPQLRALLRRYTSYISSKPELEKTTIKLLGVVIDALSRAVMVKQDHHDVVRELGTGAPNRSNEMNQIKPRSTLSQTLPKEEKLSGDMTDNLLPSMLEYLHDKDETKVSLRVPVAISIVKMLSILPKERFVERLPAVLTDVSHILRSRSQESRDLTRKTLTEMATIIGPNYFGFVLKELRSALQRGHQLHVLSFTVHSILVATASIFKPGDLDYCLPQITAIIMDDIFGTTGQEKDAEDYISKMKEVKSSKSFDSMELIAKAATIKNLKHLIRPLQGLLEEKLDLRMIKKVDELLRRIGAGILRNDAADCQETLIFCFEVINEVYHEGDEGKRKDVKNDHRTKIFLLSSQGSAVKHGGSAAYKFKLARFGIDILRSVLGKHHHLQTPASLAGFLPLIEKTIFEAHEEVQTSTFRLLSTIIKVPLQDIETKAPIYISEAFNVLRNATSTNTEQAQAALKFLTAILRERPRVVLKETSLAYLLKRLKPDLEEPDRQGVTFNFLKAVIGRKIMMPEIYEILDSIAAMMVTDHSESARTLARGIYFQFLLNYPQSKGRLAKQLSFLVKNLEYKHAEGRRSVMEAIHLLLSKTGDDLVPELMGSFFVPLTLVVVNDESSDCRTMGGELVKELFRKSGNPETRNSLSLLRTWLTQHEQPILLRVAFQIYGLILEENPIALEQDKSLLHEQIASILDNGLDDVSQADWEAMYFAIQLMSKMCSSDTELMFGISSQKLWASICQCIYFPHAWIKLASAKLLGIFFADFAKANADIEEPARPLVGSAGLELTDEKMIQLVRASLRSLGKDGVSEELATQNVRNLAFLGRYAHAQKLEGSEMIEEDLDEEEDNMANDVAAEDMDGQSRTVLEYIFQRLSSVLRREPRTTRAPSLIPKTASLQLLAILCKRLSSSTLLESIDTILLPLHNLTDPSIATPFSTDEGFKSAHQALVSSCQEIMGMLQEKLGSKDYIAALARVREGVKGRREERRIKRRIEAVAQPEKAGRDKMRKGERKKERRKEKSGEERGRRRGW